MTSQTEKPATALPEQREEVMAGNGKGGSFHLDVNDALTPDPGTEDMYVVKDNKFAYSPGQLSKLLNPKSLNAFYALGGLAGLEKGLRTNRETGLSAEESALDGSVSFEEVTPTGTPKYGANGDVEPVPKADNVASSTPQAPESSMTGFTDRRRVFSENRLPEKKSKTLLQLAWITYNDKVLILLTIAAIVSLALGLYQTFGVKHEDGQPSLEWVEGVAIMVAIVIVVLVGTINDWQMERQFNTLNKKHNDRTAKVIRSGKSVEISVFDIMVGDVMHLSTGDVVPVDGIFISGHAVKCDESSATGESDLLKKVGGDEVYAALEQAKNGNAPADLEKLDPFIISGSKINEGTGTFLVTSVGVNSSYGRITMAMHTEQDDTPLQKKLNSLADWIAKVGGGAALLLFIVLLIKFCAQLPHNRGTPAMKGQEFLRIFITAVTVVVVAVPEGLPLAVTLALAFATTRMMRDNNLVRVLKACETMGNATTVCSDKTGTLTQNKMTVVATTLGKSISFGGNEPSLDDDAASGKEGAALEKTVTQSIPNVPVADFTGGLSSATKQLIIQANAVNSTAFEGDVEGEKTFIGSKTEVALLTFSRDHLGSAPVQEERSNANIAGVIPFDSANKYMATIVKHPNGKFRAYAKGASEILLSKCTSVIADPAAEDLQAVPLTEEDHQMFLHTITSYAGQTLRTIGSSYKDFDSWPPQEFAGQADLSAADFNSIHKDFTLVAIFGIKDPLRPTVKSAILDCQRAGVVVRMVTGDNLLTGRAIAKECGIYRPEEGGIAMEGPVFRRKSDEELRELVPKLQVLARSSPEDKRILVRTLKELGETVAVTGDGTNDAPALKMADIGFAMGIAGTEVAKEAAAIILMDDNFASIVKGISWGRAVNDAVKKFLQVCCSSHPGHRCRSQSLVHLLTRGHSSNLPSTSPPSFLPLCPPWPARTRNPS
jgi:Ca2+-transporting ATPase